MIRLCKCGCGESVKLGNRFIHGHNQKGRIGILHPMYGIKGKLNPRYGMKHTGETKKKISEKTRKNNIGRHHTDETKGKISKTLMGHSHLEETKKKISKVLKNLGKTSEFRERMRNINLGRRLPISQRIKISLSNMGKRHTEEAKRKMSEASKGEKSSSWRGGISALPYPFIWDNKEFKQYILERDNYQCQNPYCKGKIFDLDRHHIDHNKQNCNEKNLIVLCRSCNSKANFNREYWENLYKSIIEEKYRKAA